MRSDRCNLNKVTKESLVRRKLLCKNLQDKVAIPKSTWGRAFLALSVAFLALSVQALSRATMMPILGVWHPPGILDQQCPLELYHEQGAVGNVADLS